MRKVIMFGRVRSIRDNRIQREVFYDAFERRYCIRLSRTDRSHLNSLISESSLDIWYTITEYVKNYNCFHTIAFLKMLKNRLETEKRVYKDWKIQYAKGEN